MKKTIAIIMAVLCLIAAGCSEKEPEVVVVDVPTTPEPAVTPVPTPDTTPEAVIEEPAYVFPYSQQYQEAQAKNSDVVGYINVPGTHISYPILYGEKFFYTDHGMDKKESDYGCVYTHLNLATHESYKTDQNIVVTAHNMRKGYAKGNVENGMFHELHHIQAVNQGKTVCGYDERGTKCEVALDKATLPDLSTPEGRTWDISVFGIESQWEVWAMYEVKKDEPEKTLYYNTWYPAGKNAFIPKDGSEVQEWINKQLDRSEIKMGVEVSTNDQFITLYTCGDNHDSDTAQSRLYVFLKQVNPASTKFNNGVRVEAPSEAAPATAPEEAPAA